MLWPKKNSYKEFDNENDALQLKKGLWPKGSQDTLIAPQMSHKLLFSNTLMNMQSSQKYLRTTAYAKFGGKRAKVYYGGFESREQPRSQGPLLLGPRGERERTLGTRLSKEYLEGSLRGVSLLSHTQITLSSVSSISISFEVKWIIHNQMSNTNNSVGIGRFSLYH